MSLSTGVQRGSPSSAFHEQKPGRQHQTRDVCLRRRKKWQVEIAVDLPALRHWDCAETETHVCATHRVHNTFWDVKGV